MYDIKFVHLLNLALCLDDWWVEVQLCILFTVAVGDGGEWSGLLLDMDLYGLQVWSGYWQKQLLASAKDWNPGHQASTLVTALYYPGSLRDMQFQSNFNPCEYLCYRILLIYYSLLLNNGWNIKFQKNWT